MGTPETRSNFEDNVELNKRMTFDEAVEVLADFHGAPSENVVRAFTFTLGRAEDGDQFEYQESFYRGENHLKIVAFSSDGTKRADTYIYKYTGQPMAKIS
jgi:hypothetical protein